MDKLILISLFLIGCNKLESQQICNELPTQDDGRQDILIIGDSISIGYTPYIGELLPQYDIVHNPCNAQNTRNGIANIDRWLSLRQEWYAITYNEGLWDISTFARVGIDEYRQNLYIIAGKIKQKTTRPLFILTTEVLPGTPYRSDNNVITYNQVAIEVMNDLGIQVLDLYSISKEIPDFHVDPHDVHYTQQGYEYLANAVYQGIINL